MWSRLGSTPAIPVKIARVLRQSDGFSENENPFCNVGNNI